MLSHEQELQVSIQDTIRKMKRIGTTGATLECLKQNVSTRNLTSTPAWYHANFPRIAHEQAKRMKFVILKGGE